MDNKNVLSAAQMEMIRAYEKVREWDYFEENPTLEEINKNDHGDFLLTFLVNETKHLKSKDDIISILEDTINDLNKTISILLEKK